MDRLKLDNLKNQNLYITFLVLLGIVLRIIYTSLDPFLNNWDERYHALVAKNMMTNPFKPMLRVDPIVPYDIHAWCYNHIWLHKQPLFLWQMAASMKIFGVSEWAMRLPSAIMEGLMVGLVFRITFLLTKNQITSIIASLMWLFSYYQLEQTSGHIGMDHNDVAFSFYILASIWAYIEYLKDFSWKWAILVGVFAGLSILNKWLTGLIIFLPWGISLLDDFMRKKYFAQLKQFCIALCCCLIIFLPWQIYILNTFPVLAKYEYAYNAKHIWEVVEKHNGSMLFYFWYFPSYFGLLTFFFLPLGFWITLKSNVFDKKIGNTLHIIFFTVLCFFSIIVKTKLPSYSYIIAPIGIIYISIAINALVLKYQFSTLSKWGLMFTFLFVLMNPVKSYINRFVKGTEQRSKKIYNTEIYKNIGQKVIKHLSTLRPLKT